MQKIHQQKLAHNTTGRFTIVEVVDEDGKSAVGVARRSNKDKSNAQLGQAIARGRALRALAQKKKGRNPQHVLCG